MGTHGDFINTLHLKSKKKKKGLLTLLTLLVKVHSNAKCFPLLLYFRSSIYNLEYFHSWKRLLHSKRNCPQVEVCVL